MQPTHSSQPEGSAGLRSFASTLAPPPETYSISETSAQTHLLSGTLQRSEVSLFDRLRSTAVGSLQGGVEFLAATALDLIYCLKELAGFVKESIVRGRYVIAFLMKCWALLLVLLGVAFL